MGSDVYIAEGTSVAATIGVTTVAAPTQNVRNTIAVYGIRISATGAPAAAIAALLAVAGATVMTIQIPAAWTGEPLDLPMPPNHPYVAGHGAANAGAVTLTIPSLGGAIVSTGQIFYAVVAL